MICLKFRKIILHTQHICEIWLTPRKEKVAAIGIPCSHLLSAFPVPSLPPLREGVSAPVPPSPKGSQPLWGPGKSVHPIRWWLLVLPLLLQLVFEKKTENLY